MSVSTDSDDDFIYPRPLDAAAISQQVAHNGKKTGKKTSGRGGNRKRQKIHSDVPSKENIDANKYVSAQVPASKSGSKSTHQFDQPRHHECSVAATNAMGAEALFPACTNCARGSFTMTLDSSGQLNGLPDRLAEARRGEAHPQQNEAFEQERGLSRGVSRQVRSGVAHDAAQTGGTGANDVARHQDEIMALYLSQLDVQLGAEEDAALWEECPDDPNAVAVCPALESPIDPWRGRGAQPCHQVPVSLSHQQSHASASPRKLDPCTSLGSADPPSVTHGIGDEVPVPCQTLSDGEDWDIDGECEEEPGDAPASPSTHGNNDGPQAGPGLQSPVHAPAISQQELERASCCESITAPAYDPGPLVHWLAVAGLEKFEHIFTRAEVTVELLPLLAEEDLTSMGIESLGPRRRILAAIAQRPSCLTQSSGPPPAFSAAVQSTGQMHSHENAAGPLNSNPGGPTGRDQTRQGHAAGRFKFQAPKPGQITRFFQREGSGVADLETHSVAAHPGGLTFSGSAAGQITRFLQRPSSHVVGPEPLPEGGRSGQASGSTGGMRCSLPEWQAVPGTRFVVDRFGKGTEHVPCKHWFLTHFHADHYKGLTSKFRLGTVYCTQITASLVNARLRLPLSRMHVVPLNTPIMVEGVRITFVDANHCPGAAMILFEPPSGPPILHTGDCRCNVRMQEEACLAPVRGRAQLILDTTYCDPQYSFPPQDEVLQFALDAVKAEAFNPSTLFLFGSYTIGKERLFLEVARALDRKVYVSKAKRAVLDCLGLPPAYARLLTTNDREADIHAVPLWMVSQQHMERILKHYKSRYTTIVGFQPTGWTQKSGHGKAASRGRRIQKGTLVTYQLPYSEHSSFEEMRDFVAWLRPTRIVPSVGNDRGPRAQEMVKRLKAAIPAVALGP